MVYNGFILSERSLSHGRLSSTTKGRRQVGCQNCIVGELVVEVKVTGEESLEAMPRLMSFIQRRRRRRTGRITYFA